MPSAFHQTSARLVQTAPGALSAPSTIAVFALTVPDGINANLDWTGIAGLAFRVIDAWAIKTGGAGGAADAVRLRTSADAVIGNSMDLNVGDTTIVRLINLSDATDDIAAGGGLRVQRIEGAADGSCVLYVKVALF